MLNLHVDREPDVEEDSSSLIVALSIWEKRMISGKERNYSLRNKDVIESGAAQVGQ